MRSSLRTRYSRSWNSLAGAQATDPVVDFSERADDQEGRGHAAVAQLPHHRNAIDVVKHAVDRDHGIVVCHTVAQRFVAAGSQIHLLSDGRELFQKLTGGFRIVLDDQNAAVATRHGVSPTIATGLSGS